MNATMSPRVFRQKRKTCGLIGLAILLAIIIPLQFFLQVFVAKGASLQMNVRAFAADTIAGYSTFISTSRTYPNQKVVFEVKKSDGAVVTLAAIADVNGVAKADFYDYHTRRAGKYAVAAYLENDGASNGNGAVSYFTVYPDRVSAEKSMVVASKNIAIADGIDKVYVTVKVRDQYGNPFSGHVVSLISSRAKDTVVSSSKHAVTDINGSLTFTVISAETGFSSYSVVDVTSDVVLTTRVQVAYLNAQNYLTDVGGDLSMLVPVALAQDSGVIHNFDISGIPQNVQANQNVSLQVMARDANDLTVQNYTGMIHFSVDGDNSGNVTLPEDYSFKAEDLGEHEFSLGLKFTTAGTYKIVVTDVTNHFIKGEEIVTVGGGGLTQNGVLQKPTIILPSAGIYNQNIQTISGNALPGLTIKIFVNDQEIGTVQVGSAGLYSFQTVPLADGVNKIYVATLDSTQKVQASSKTVEVMIDTTPPVVDEIKITPATDITAGSVMTIKVLSEENLAQAAVIFNQNIIELSSSLEQSGVYVGTVQAPADPGVYPLDIVLVDQLGNEATYDDQAAVTITPTGGTVSQTTDQTQKSPLGQPQPENLPPTQVFGLIAYGSDKRVTLVWEAANDDGIIKNYRVYYGLDPAMLINAVDTKNAATTWYVPNLENGKEYFFAVTALDDFALESVNKSELTSAIPFALEVTALPAAPTFPLAVAQQEILLRGATIEGRVPPELSQEGPAVLWLLLGSGGLAGLSRVLSRVLSRRRN